jgi:ATP-dependent Lhr-like helicase
MVSERELGLSLDKSEQTSDWSRRPLDADQVRYAALDAEILLELHERLSSLEQQRQPPLLES